MKSIDEIKQIIKTYLLPAVSYGLPSLLLITLTFMIVSATIFGNGPTPGSPPHEYYAEEDRVRLFWHRGTHKGPFTLQVARDEDFANPVFTQKTNKTAHHLPRLAPGRRYCWRLLADDGAEVSCFRTSHRLVAY